MTVEVFLNKKTSKISANIGQRFLRVFTLLVLLYYVVAIKYAKRYKCRLIISGLFLVKKI